MKKIIFAIHTEYHLLFALKVVSAFHNREKENIVFYRLSRVGTKRLNMTLNFEGTGLEYREVLYNNKLFSDGKYKETIDNLVSEKPDMLYVFNESQKYYPYLFSKLKKGNTKIILCPDGVGTYSCFIPFKERVLHYLFDNLYLWSNGFPSYMSFPRNQYAHTKEIDAVVVENSGAYHNCTHKEVIELSSDKVSKQQFLDDAYHVFGYKVDDCIIEPGSILWIDQPIDEIINSKHNLLHSLHKRYPNKMIYIKPHPRSNQEEMCQYEKEIGFEIIKINIPIEMIIENLIEVNLFSAYSASMYYYNPTCRYFWCAALFNELPSQTYSNATFSYIKVITDINQIEL